METVSPGKSIFKTSEVSRGAKMAIGINSKPSDIPVNLQIIERPGLAKILDVNFTGSLFKNFISNRDGEDTMMITNLGSKEVSANTVFGNSDFFDSSGQPKIFLGAAAVSGIILSFASIIILYSRWNNSLHRQKKSEKNETQGIRIRLLIFASFNSH
ncbi:MAG: hypothetical protein WBQ16_08610 [Nitrososphaeraceae archaeon]